MPIELNHGRNYLIKEKYYIKGASTMVNLNQAFFHVLRHKTNYLVGRSYYKVCFLR